MEFKEYQTSEGEIILYLGNPNLEKIEQLANGYGDVWHSSFEQGYKNAFQDIVYQVFVFFWYINDFDALDECISWRINPNLFAVRKSVWEKLGGFDSDFSNLQLAALDFGFNALRNQGAIPLYSKGLYTDVAKDKVVISTQDRYDFYIKNFKIDHAIFMLYRKGFWNLKEWNCFLKAKKNFKQRKDIPINPPRELAEIKGNPTVSYIIPTMMRQDFTLNLLNDLKNQTFVPTQVIVVDATPTETRDESLYNPNDYPFEVQFHWQTTKGSCRARNEGIEKCTSEYIVFGDDDIRVPPDYLEKHIRLLQTYNAGACNGLDIRADHQKQTLEDLKYKLDNYKGNRWLVGSSGNFNNANSCVRREYVQKLGGNDVNYDGGYGEDSDFGISLTKIGVAVLNNPFATNLHLKPPVGGYRFWGTQAKVMGKKRKKQPWELDTPVKNIRPVPSPTIMYQIHKQYKPEQFIEYKQKYFVSHLAKGKFWELPIKLIKLPYKLMQFNKSVFYAKKLVALGTRTK
ncbi:glycosyltransferase family 2 protein [Flavobacterium sp. SUN052]|uniref:glycosyltransferase family 2 protein n=1 Tax=Flavobacterium sp. SUN052 TaxID=3002441 RepID=UPI00237E9597|nr:glycosyltransferase family 2 protein [Flavobacterium sp. SUN052]MEC4004394.1 glycosyltransferase family 2 protein [Flavobacterium sp. SUN052]